MQNYISIYRKHWNERSGKCVVGESFRAVSKNILPVITVGYSPMIYLSLFNLRILNFFKSFSKALRKLAPLKVSDEENTPIDKQSADSGDITLMQINEIDLPSSEKKCEIMFRWSFILHLNQDLLYKLKGLKILRFIYFYTRQACINCLISLCLP